MKYNARTKTIGGVTFVFVTRGKSKEFSDEEINTYLKQKIDGFRNFPIDIKEPIKKDTFVLKPELRNIFMKDLRQFGVSFCANKYGVTEEEITRTATDVAPHFRSKNE